MLCIGMLSTMVLAKDANSSDPVVWTNFNTAGVITGELDKVTLFSFNDDTLITCVTTYHYGAKGKKPGTISIYTENGTLVGTWNAVGRAGYKNVANAYWDIYPNVVLKANTVYYVEDSDPSTWSWNSGSKNCGFVELCGYISSEDPVIWTNFNTASVTTGGLEHTALFSFDSDTILTSVRTYHWNNGRGKAPGTISIYTKDDKLVGTWNAIGRAGYKNVPNANWDIYPNVVLKANTVYYVIDSDPDTWSWNSGSDNCGFVELCGHSKGTANTYSWAGTWDTSFNKMILTQNGNSVTGYYEHDNGKISGTISGNTLRGTWTEDGNEIGEFIFTMSADGKSFTGSCGWGESNTGMTWNGQR